MDRCTTGVSSASLAALPTEILFLITKRLDLAALARLADTCHVLYHRLEEELYSRPGTASKALTWAVSKGVTATIRRAVTFGADVSAVPGTDGRTRSTLWLAAKNNHLNAIECLLDLGADMNMASTRQRDYHKFLRWLCWQSHSDTTFLLKVLKTEASRQIIKNGLNSLDLCLYMKTRRKSPSMDVVRLILQLGASPRRLQLAEADLDSPEPLGLGKPSGKTIQCPLVCAMVYGGSRPLFDLLLEYGADIHGKSGTSIGRSRDCVPIYCATLIHSIPYDPSSKAGDMSWMLACLEAGADINHPGNRESQPGLQYDQACSHKDEHCYLSCSSTWPCRFLSPLTSYLAGINTYSRGEFSQHVWPEELAGVQFFLDRGAVLWRPAPSPSQHHPPERWGNFHPWSPLGPPPLIPHKADNPIVYSFLLNLREHKTNAPVALYQIMHYLWDRQPLDHIDVAKRLLCEHKYVTWRQWLHNEPPDAEHGLFVRRVIREFWRYRGEDAATDLRFIETLKSGDGMEEYQIAGGWKDFE
ncbi:uncharacterized protein B0I36DRAFT_84839 [Microdochium trichocladiopsis]|uniref:F-box domain-containing protein n=1 Tax=Microdochium trichocladiopsis TaxID=1682393 RepID=A0A9P9BQG4_9PEZI|nr:uncharacterized protein B0I36DRAFT_84839 [Microdochium trichocladiopsis]KAH7034858.1 hypothetical protein B0I36DRAFT_84839 [Microdochium trichocladiopsis]